MTFYYFIKNVYGNTTYYPVGEEFTNFVAKFGQKTITPNIFQALEIVGVKAERIMEPIPSKGIPATMYHIFDKR